MKGSNSSFAYAVAMICWFAVLFAIGCLALSAQSHSSHHQQQQQVKARHTRALYVSSTSPSNRSRYYTEIECPHAAADDDEKLTLIFCTVKCYCHGYDQCYCCQLKFGSKDPPVCYDKVEECQANCPICNPKCPPAPPATAAPGLLA